MLPDTPAAPTPLAMAARFGARVKWALVLLGALGLGLLGWLFFREAKQDDELARWDDYAQLRGAHEDRETFFEKGSELTQAVADRYVTALEAFIATLEKQGIPDALEPQTRWRLVKTEGESLLAMQDVLDVAKRLPHTERALQQLDVIQQRFPDFPLNWGGVFAPQGFANQTRKLAQWFRDNAAWEREWLPKDTAPDAGTVIVFRTDRGDLRLGLYSTLGPRVTARMLADVQSGFYDGTVFTTRFEDESTGQTTAQGVRAGDARSRGAKAFDREGHLAFAKEDDLEPVLPDETRNRVLQLRGVVSAWHRPQDGYDHPHELLFLARDGSTLNYLFTPIGRLLDADSLATLDRIHGAKTWREDPLVAKDSGDLSLLKDVYKAPATIVKALAYKDGALLAPGKAPLPSKAAPDASEATLATLKPDAYRQEPPVEPAPAPAPLPAPPDTSKPPAPAEPVAPK